MQLYNLRFALDKFIIGILSMFVISRFFVSICLFLLLTLPFLFFPKVVGNFFWIKELSFLIVIFLLIAVFASKGMVVAPPALFYFCITFALFLYLQSVVIPPVFKGQLYAVMVVFFVAALLAYAMRYWVVNWGQDSLLLTLAWALAIGATVQAMVAIIQFVGADSVVPLILPPKEQYQAVGQMGQRNQLGHYLMWGVLACAYLWHKQALKPVFVLMLLFFLTASMGLVGSRTIIAFAITLSISISCLWILTQEKHKHLLKLFGVALVMVVVFQFIEPLLSIFLEVDHQSGVSRLADTQANVGRLSEWSKAWQLFLHSPWIGHGWGNYATQSFLLPELDDFRRYELHNLFDNSHNIVLQLLAEVGFFGALMVIGAIFMSVRFFFRNHTANHLFLLMLIVVSLTHSLFEFPLWFLYFFFPFIVFLSAGDIGETRKRIAIKPILFKGILILICVAILGRFFLINGSYSAVWLTFDNQEESLEKKQEKAALLQQFLQLEFFLDYPIALGFINNFSADDEILSTTLVESASKAIYYMPYRHVAFERGLYLYRQGKFDEADEWIAATVRYYPQNLPAYVEATANSVHFQALAQPLYEACEVYRRINPEIGSCVPSEAESN